MKDIKINNSDWLEEAMRSRAGCKTVFREGMDKYLAGQAVQTPVAARVVVCKVCSRKIHKEVDKKWQEESCGITKRSCPLPNKQ